MSWSWRRAVGSWALVLGVLMFFVLVSVGSPANSYRLARHGVAATATVTSFIPQDHDGCAYTYVVASRTYGGSAQVCFAKHGVGAPLTVYYLRDDPSVSSTTGPGLRPLEVLAAITLVAPVFVGAVAGLVGPRRRRLPA